MRRLDIPSEQLRQWALVVVLCVAVGAAVPIGIAMLSGSPWTTLGTGAELIAPTPMATTGSAFRTSPSASTAARPSASRSSSPEPGPSSARAPSAAPTSARPAITVRVPGPGAVKVPRGTSIRVVFSAPVRKVSGQTVRLVNVAGGWPVRASVSYVAATRTIVLNPELLMYGNTRYRVEIGPGITDEAGHRLAAATWTFRTGR